MTDPTPAPSADPTPAATLLSSEPAPGAPTPPATATHSYVADDGAFVQGWTDKLPEEFGDKRGNLGKFKGIADLGKSYLELENRLGKHANATYVPGPDAKSEEIAAYRKAIGVPDSASGYSDLRPTTLPEGVDWNDENAKPYYDLAAAEGIPKATMAKLIDLQVKQEQIRVDAINTEVNKQIEAGKETLQKEWGGDYQKNILKVAQAVKMAGFDPADGSALPGLRDPNTIKAFLHVANQISDGKFQTSSAGTLSPKGSAHDIMTNPDNQYHKRYQDGDPTVVSMVRDQLKRAA